MKRKKKLAMYVWEGVLRDYTGGMVAVLAYSADHARKLAQKECDYMPEGELAADPKVITKPKAFVQWGGG